jgi:hypothetical protein
MVLLAVAVKKKTPGRCCQLWRIKEIKGVDAPCGVLEAVEKKEYVNGAASSDITEIKKKHAEGTARYGERRK